LGDAIDVSTLLLQLFVKKCVGGDDDYDYDSDVAANGL
jgi:hypothetical protein